MTHLRRLTIREIVFAPACLARVTHALQLFLRPERVSTLEHVDLRFHVSQGAMSIDDKQKIGPLLLHLERVLVALCVSDVSYAFRGTFSSLPPSGPSSLPWDRANLFPELRARGVEVHAELSDE